MKTRFCLCLSIFFAVVSGCQKKSDDAVKNVPEAPTNLTATSISTTAIVLAWKDNSTNEKGFKVERKTGNGSYTMVSTTTANTVSYIDTGLTSNTMYTYRVYSFNSDGNSVTSNELDSKTKKDPVILDSVVIGSQVWSLKNLDVVVYNNGDSIPKVSHAQFANLTTGAYTIYNSYGKLYNWYAISDPRGLAPAGWHIPSDSEWTILATFLGGDTIAGGKMKDTASWSTTNPNAGGATNSSGFTAKASGYVGNNGIAGPSGYGVWWSTSESSTTNVWTRVLSLSSAALSRGNLDNKKHGYAVRCIKD